MAKLSSPLVAGVFSMGGWLGNQYSTTGPHLFSIAGDDQSELWLSTSENKNQALRIAHVPSWTNYLEYTKSPSQTSAPIPLVAGNRYYIEILHKQGGGGEHCTVEWQVPGSSTRALIPSENLGCLPAEQIEW